MSRPKGADVKESIEEEHFCINLENCRTKLNATLQKIYNRGFRGYVNLESFENSDYISYGNYGDMEKNKWESLENTEYLHLPTIDMKPIKKDHLEKLLQLYDNNPDIDIIIHCLCGKGRTGNAILFLVLNNNLHQEYNPIEIFPYQIYKDYIVNNFNPKSGNELFNMGNENLSISINFYCNLFLKRINEINTYIGINKQIPFYLYKPFIKDVHNWANDGPIQNWLENKKTTSVYCHSCETIQENYKEMENKFICKLCNVCHVCKQFLELGEGVELELDGDICTKAICDDCN